MLPTAKLTLFEITYFTLQWEINLVAVIQSKAQRLWSMTRLLSGMSMNQSRLVQSNLWQETTSLWDTPAVHLYAVQQHKQLSTGGSTYCSCQGRNMFPFFHFPWQRRPYKCSSISLAIAHSFESLRFCQFSPQYKHSMGSLVTASHYYPETAARLSCTGRVPKDSAQIPALSRQAVSRAKRISQLT